MIVEANMPKGQLVPLVSYLNVENKEDIDLQGRVSPQATVIKKDLNFNKLRALIS